MTAEGGTGGTVTIGRYNKKIAARNLGEISAPTPTNLDNGLHHARKPSVLTVEVYVHERAPSKHTRLAFAVKPLPYCAIQLDVIGMMKQKWFLVDCIMPVSHDGLEFKLPPLTHKEARDLVSIVREQINEQIAPLQCKPIPPDLLDIEVLGRSA